jgi:hypothetical protein
MTELRGDLSCRGWVKPHLLISVCNVPLISLHVNIAEGGICRFNDGPATCECLPSLYPTAKMVKKNVIKLKSITGKKQKMQTSRTTALQLI